MVECWSPKPVMRVRFLLPLPQTPGFIGLFCKLVYNANRYKLLLTIYNKSLYLNGGVTSKIMSKLTKSQLLDAMAGETGMSKKDVGSFMEKLANLALKEVKKSGEFVIPGLGKLVKINRAARMGRNPATGESIQIKAKTVVKFRVAKAAKEAVL